MENLIEKSGVIIHYTLQNNCLMSTFS